MSIGGVCAGGGSVEARSLATSSNSPFCVAEGWFFDAMVPVGEVGCCEGVQELRRRGLCQDVCPDTRCPLACRRDGMCQDGLCQGACASNHRRRDRWLVSRVQSALLAFGRVKPWLCKQSSESIARFSVGVACFGILSRSQSSLCSGLSRRSRPSTPRRSRPRWSGV